MSIKNLIKKAKKLFEQTAEQTETENSYQEKPYLLTNRNTQIDKSLFNIKYSIDSLVKSTNGYCYLLADNNIEIAIEDILSLNSLLHYAKSEYSEIPYIELQESDLRFDENIVNDFPAYCSIAFRELTKTGKLPKYPYVLNVYISEDLFCEIYYNQQNEIGKVWFIIKTYTEIYELSFILNEGEVDLKIYKTSHYGYEKEKVYPPKFQSQNSDEGNAELAYQLLQTIPFDEIPESPYKYKVMQMVQELPNQEDRLLTVLELAFGTSTPKRRYVTAIAFSMLGNRYTQKAIYYLEEYINNELCLDCYKDSSREIHLAEMYECLGNAYKDSNNFNDALWAYSESIKLSSCDAALYVNMVDILIKINKSDVAKKVIAQAKTNHNYNNSNSLVYKQFKSAIDSAENELNKTLI